MTSQNRTQPQIRLLMDHIKDRLQGAETPMTVRARSRLALACAAAYFGWPLIKHTPDALEALAFILGVKL